MGEETIYVCTKDDSLEVIRYLLACDNKVLISFKDKHDKYRVYLLKQGNQHYHPYLDYFFSIIKEILEIVEDDLKTIEKYIEIRLYTFVRL